MLTPKQRFGALMEGRQPDRVPVVCNLFEQGAKELGMPIKEYYSRGEYVAEGQIRLYEKYGYDHIWGAHYTARDSEMLGSRRTVFVEDGPPNVGHLIIKTEKDIENLVIDPGLLDTKPFAEQVKTIEIVKREKGDECPVLSTVIGSFSMPPILMGMDGWLDLMLTGPEKTRKLLLKKCSDFCIMKMKALFQAGVDMIAYSNPVATASFISLAQFEAMALEWIKRDINALGPRGIVYFNGGGLLNPMIKPILEHTGAGVFYIHPMDDIVQAKEIVAGRALVAAAINDVRLIDWPEERIEAQVRQMMDQGAQGGGFVFGTLVMPFAIPDKKIKTMIEAAHRFGTY
ncbi:uroporphyrinogen decarboxylase family protein [Desulfospira joergensenii]|uniref:uroporphyrinogen decarboxylase family protein n=1 Tax=Desulfospira joergensenii TaxID=53329 RepID=UPI0003F56FA0|nr:uroporphyrinogen decarboxylase family protein [Desulfospira joergensenii]